MCFTERSQDPVRSIAELPPARKVAGGDSEPFYLPDGQILWPGGGDAGALPFGLRFPIGLCPVRSAVSSYRIHDGLWRNQGGASYRPAWLAGQGHQQHPEPVGKSRSQQPLPESASPVA